MTCDEESHFFRCSARFLTTALPIMHQTPSPRLVSISTRLARTIFFCVSRPPTRLECSLALAVVRAPPMGGAWGSFHLHNPIVIILHFSLDQPV